jgi:hypothetical protein
VKTLFRDRNLGCRAGVSSAIDWFFEHEEEGIILEDDCLPSPYFFKFCEELLAHFRYDTRVMCISGDNSVPLELPPSPSYVFSRYPYVWGWATWRRAWSLYRRDLEMITQVELHTLLSSISPSPNIQQFWSEIFSRLKENGIDTWDYYWNFSCLLENGLTCVPRVNLISNLGFRPDATHTFDVGNPRSKLPAGRLDLPIIHPFGVFPSAEYDAHAAKYVFGIKLEQPSNKLKRVARGVTQSIRAFAAVSRL